MGLTERRHLPALDLSSLAFPLHRMASGPAVLSRETFDQQGRQCRWISSNGNSHLLSR